MGRHRGPPGLAVLMPDAVAQSFRPGTDCDGHVVTYELHRDERGRPRAEKIAFAGDRVSPARRHGRVTVPLVFAGVFVCLVAGGVVAGKLPWILLAC